MKYFFLICSIIGICVFGQCAMEKKSIETKNKTADKKTSDGHLIISAEIVKKNFVNKEGKISEREEFYLRRSVQDYFIKFCEGGITESAFEALFGQEKRLIKSFKMEVEFKQGAWDSCDDNEKVQSRGGKYVVIHKILE